MATVTRANSMFVYQCEMQIALGLALSSNPEIAADSARTALHVAILMRRPDLAFAANEVLAALGGGL